MAHGGTHTLIGKGSRTPDLRMPPAQVGMLSFILAEASFFVTLIMVYVVFIGQDLGGPTPAKVLSLPLVLVSTCCLLSSSVTVHFAHKALAERNLARFFSFWLLTIGLGAAFLALTAVEWRTLIYGDDNLTISTNLFGTTYFTLVGFHASHVAIGLVAMLIVLGLVRANKVTDHGAVPVEMVSWYWHFVDCVWIVVFSVVYLLGR